MGSLHRFPPLNALDDLAKRSGGGDNGDMDGRIGKLEGIVGQLDKRLGNMEAAIVRLGDKIDRHLILLASMITAVALGLAGLMAKGFGWL